MSTKAKNNKAMRAESVAPWRFYLAIAMLLILVSLLIGRLLVLQVLDTDRGYEFLQGQGDARTLRTENIPAYRGVISDRNGEPLAVSTPVSSIWINPKQLINEKNRWAELAAVLDMPVSEIEKKVLANQQRGFLYLRRHMSPVEANKVSALKITGVGKQQEYKRYYPAAEVAAHMVGFTNIDDQGQEGMELAYNQWLQGESGSKRVLKDLHGNVFREVEEGKPARSGSDLSLSIDMRLQYLAYRELKAAMGKVGAKSGSIVLLDSHTGEVLAMVNQPSFNPNNRQFLKPANLRNRAVTDMFEPGSTVKPLTVIAALESGQYHPDTLVDTNPGYIKVGKKTLVDPVNYGVMDVTKILTKSSQVGISKMALDLDEQSVWSVFHRFGLGVDSGSGFPGESAGLLPNRSKWLPIERANFAFGYGLTVTPLQLAQAYSVIANDGVFHPVSLLRKDDEEDGTQVISEKISHQIVDMLKTVVLSGGTATGAQVDSYTVAGKTGTVHKVGKHGYADDRYTAIFAGIAPASNPRLVAVVMIDEPDLASYHGGESAAPVFSKVMGDALRMLDIAPDKIAPSHVVTRERVNHVVDDLAKGKSA
jgi:cell division protein FtsI (penicillin-binding protein 3)